MLCNDLSGKGYRKVIRQIYCTGHSPFFVMYQNTRGFSFKLSLYLIFGFMNVTRWLLCNKHVTKRKTIMNQDKFSYDAVIQYNTSVIGAFTIKIRM